MTRSYWTICDYRGNNWGGPDFVVYEISNGNTLHPSQFFSSLEEARAALPVGLSRATKGLPTDEMNDIVERWE